jgi:chromosome segregation protein
VRPAPRLEVARDQYRIGVAADLVQAEERLTPIVDMLLGHVVVVRDLETARHLLRRRARAARTEAGRTSDAERGGWQAVTLLGEVLRSSGSITGGETQSQAQGQVLSREREWRELPRQVESAQVHHEALERALDKAQATEERLSQKVDTVAARRQEIEQALLRAQGDRRDVERDAAQIAQQIAWHQGLSAQLEDELQEIDAAESSLQSTLADLEAEAAAAERRTADLRALLEELRGEVLYQQLSEARTAEAIARGTWEHRRTALEGLRDSAAQLEAQMEAKSQRIRDIENEQTSLAEQIAKHTSREAVIQGWLTSLAQKIDPAEEEALQIESERDQLLEQEGSLRSRLREAESNHAQALLAKSRQEDRLERLRQQIMDDFGLVEMEPMEGVPEQPPLPLGELVSALPTIETLPEGLEEEIQQIKAQLRRIGPTNPGAPEEYGETLDRYTFLTTQATDLEEAARSLRQVISELDDVMRREFHATFDAIATRFEESFARLFGGGTARLVLTDPSDVHSTGIDIVARPPGKRQQALALLSGGERALTAAALIFSILEASPPPFCVLDEVDAMLDEANIKRFRQALEALAQDTQCIVITHNRGTIQAANTLYGVSMGDDSVSQVVSLQLDGDRIARPDGSTVEMKTG